MCPVDRTNEERGYDAASLGFGHAKRVLLLFNKEDISKMRQMLKEDWVEIPAGGTFVFDSTKVTISTLVSNHFVLRHSYMHSECKESYYQGKER